MIRRNERGMVTAELAVTMLSVVMVAAATVWGALGCLTQVRAGQVAGQVARLEARGDGALTASLLSRNKDLRVAVRREGAYAKVMVSGTSPRLGVLPGLAVTASAEMALEPGEHA